MLTIVIPAFELYDELNNEFISCKEQKLNLEHSLVSVSKWESKWNKSFLSKGPQTIEETIDYIRCMTITQNVNPNVYKGLTNTIVQEINEYIEKPMTATWFHDTEPPRRSEVITSELIYFWMISFGIPFECQKWHLNRLLTLIRVCSIKNGSQKKMSNNKILQSNHQLNEARKKALKTKG